MSIFRLIVLMSFLTFFTSLIYGQTDTVVVESAGGATCEAVTASMDGFVQNTKLDKNIIGIVSTGSSENRSGLTEQRLRTVRNYFSERLRKTQYFRDDEKIVLAAADRRPGKGRVDFYVDGSLVLQIVFAKNSFLALSSCVTGNP